MNKFFIRAKFNLIMNGEFTLLLVSSKKENFGNQNIEIK